ncbi:uncharacterized protein LOC133888985 [Phragmites australis]|uniref:uncharacterized protein LOC133888985 n=1 Tax=Phragmites australis TaxID=29695 RepID=UPI002D78A459|nr:uncharacterized protein LOC133888985 [Phragmites australis]
MFDAVSVLLSSLARRPVPRRRGKSITSSAFITRRPFFPCGAGHRDVSASPFAKPRTLRRLKPRRIGERKGGRDDGNGDLLDGDEPCVWRRTILLGRRCQPLEFTGAIHYDSEGQRLWQPRTTPLLTSPIHSSELGYMDRA